MRTALEVIVVIIGISCGIIALVATVIVTNYNIKH